ncbi:hypothetical protein GCG21_08790 [Pseudactinotalea sp. HY160]|uniref:hypothetical protein n=1 Tax=Pseudactinotalea sp. HY160 TaxID=2654490 RepID=UPI00128CF765|nr:hypothetical protein [Pseudactinotalea sp. HY160]MPV50101.1 hypothetical protein [Pseudactinotalea sp. HY160]
MKPDELSAIRDRFQAGNRDMAPDVLPLLTEIGRLTRENERWRTAATDVLDAHDCGEAFNRALREVHRLREQVDHERAATSALAAQRDDLVEKIVQVTRLHDARPARAQEWCPNCVSPEESWPNRIRATVTRPAGVIGQADVTRQVAETGLKENQ